MFDVGWSEMLVIAVVMIVVVGPKDLPNMLRTFGRTTAKLRAMAADFQRQFNDALKEAELDDIKKSVDELRGLSPVAEIKKQLNPFEQAAADVRSGVDNMMKPKPAADPAPAASTPQASEPLKNGATAMPGVNEPDTTPATPIFPAMTDESVVTAAVEQPTAPQETPAVKKATKATPAKAEPAAKATPKVSTAATKASSPGKATAAKASPVLKAPAGADAAKPTVPKAAKAAVTKAVAAKIPAVKAEPKSAAAKKPATTGKKTAGAAK